MAVRELLNAYVSQTTQKVSFVSGGTKMESFFAFIKLFHFKPHKTAHVWSNQTMQKE